MPTHPRELILAAFASTLTGLATTGTNVFRGRPGEDELQDSELPGLLVSQGDDNNLETTYTDTLQEMLVNVDAVHAVVGLPETTLNQVEVEVTAALLATESPWLGLAFIDAVFHDGTAAPQTVAIGDRPATLMRMVWRVKYARARVNFAV